MTWWTRFWRRSQMEAQLDKELSFHIEQHTEQLIAQGHAPDEARRQARLALGGPEQVKEKCRDARGMRWLEDLLQDSRYALRTFRQKPGFAILALAILALGIGATTVMFAIINSVLLRPLSYPQPDRLITVHGFTQTFGEFWGSSNPDFIDAQRGSRSLDIAGWTEGGGTISAPGEPQYVDGRKISANLFSTLGIAPVYGRTFRPDEDQPGAAPVAIISYSLWQRDLGGNPAAVGSSLVFEGQAYSVVGIAPAGLQLSGDSDVFTPLGQSTDPRMRNREAPFIHAIARLRPGFTLAAAQAELTLIARHLAEQYPKSNAGLSMMAHPLQQELVRDIGSTLWLLLSAVGLVMLIACVNIASLLLARAVSRDRELAVRIALGAGRGRLARQCLTESAMLGLTGGMLGVLFAAISVRPFVLLWPGSLPRAEEVHLDWRVLVFVYRRVPLQRSPFRARAGPACSHRRIRTGLTRRGAKHRWHVAAFTQRVRRLRDCPRGRAAGRSRDAWPHASLPLVPRPRSECSQYIDGALRTLSRRVGQSRADPRRLAGRNRSRSHRSRR